MSHQETIKCFESGAIIASDDMQIIENASLVVKSGRILEIGETVPGTKVIDMRDKVLCPMFIDAHTHVGDTGAKELGTGMPLEDVVVYPNGLKHRFFKSLDDETHIQMMRHGLIEMLTSGIIACADFREQGIKGVRALRKAAEGLPIRVVILGRMDEAVSAQQADAEGREILQEADGIGVREVTSYDLDMLKRLRADHPEKIFGCHSSENIRFEQKSIELTGRGQTARNIDWGPDFLVHLIHTPVEDLQLLARRGIIAVSCPRVGSIIGDGLPDFGLWQRNGVTFTLGTDNVMLNAPDMLQEMDFASRLVRGMHMDPTVIDARTILQAATVAGAKALQLDNELGSLAPNKEASFIAFDLQTRNLTYQRNILSTIVHRAKTSDISNIYIKGEPLEF
jgi:cytosine/adenosine deaminase-related metal-dependent hydrolase